MVCGKKLRQLRFGVVCVGLLFTAGGATGQTETHCAETPETITIPANFHASSFVLVGNKIVVHVRLNDKVDGNMILDTGANTCLTPQAVAPLGLQLEPFPEAGPKSQYGEIASLMMNSIKLEKFSVEVSSLPFLEDWNREHPQFKACGLLGSDALQDGALGLDFVSHTLAWWQGGKLSPEQARSFNSLIYASENAQGTLAVVRPGHSISYQDRVIANPPLEANGLQTLPLSTKPDEPYYFVPAKLDGLPAEFVLDTGSDGVILPEAMGTKLSPLFRTANVLNSIDAESNATTMIVRSLRLGNVSIDFPDITILMPQQGKRKSAFESLPILGVDVLRNCRVIMDFPGKTFYLAAYASDNRAKHRVLKRLGILLEREGERITIFGLFAGYSGAKAGLQAGDEILNVNGTPGRSWVSDMDRILPDKPLTFRVRRQGVPKPLTFTLPLPAP